MMFIPDPVFFSLRIPDPGIKKVQKHRIRICITGFSVQYRYRQFGSGLRKNVSATMRQFFPEPNFFLLSIKERVLHKIFRTVDHSYIKLYSSFYVDLLPC
jgi:hypothetical protein